jgi:hypothetical protein
MFGRTQREPGFLNQLDSQQLLTYDNLTKPGSVRALGPTSAVCAGGVCDGPQGMTQY